MIIRLQIENYKSIRDQDIALNHLNLLIGPNGSGKSNFISLFRFLEQLSEQQLHAYVFQSGGINNFLFNGYEESQRIRVYLELTKGKNAHLQNIYDFTLLSDGEDFQFEQEQIGVWNIDRYTKPLMYSRGEKAGQEARLKNAKSRTDDVGKVADYVYKYLTDLKLFHFHDTSDNAQVKLPQPIEDVYFFKAEAENLAPLLMHFRDSHFEYYHRIVEVVRLIYPHFQDFVLEESPLARGKVVLRWREKSSGQIFSVKQISDGTLRFICLATLLIQPPGTNYVPNTIVLDEPELGLHPFAIQVLAELLQKAALQKQVIVATQSVNLINYFQPENLLVVDRDDSGASVFRRLQDEDYEAWLDDYSLGQLWEKNFFGGRP